MVGARASDELPETLAMIELSQMTHLMHDDVFSKMRREERNFVIETQVAAV